jgi:hypothetical protein
MGLVGAKRTGRLHWETKKAAAQCESTGSWRRDVFNTAGATFWPQYIPVYLVPGLVGAAGAAFLYDFLANPKLVEEPVIEAVSHGDAITADSRQLP